MGELGGGVVEREREHESVIEKERESERERDLGVCQRASERVCEREKQKASETGV